MHRRNFLKKSGVLATAWASKVGFGPMLSPLRLSASEGASVDDNPNLADPALGATASASSVSKLSSFSFAPSMVFGENLSSNWESDTETRGAWLEISFPEEKSVREIWLLTKPIPDDIVEDPYMRGAKDAGAAAGDLLAQRGGLRQRRVWPVQKLSDHYLSPAAKDKIRSHHNRRDMA